MITLSILFGMVVLHSCDEEEDIPTGLVTFGADYSMIYCNSIVTVYVDDIEIGTLANSTDTIIDCKDESNITQELSTGNYSYRFELRPETGTGYSKDLNGNFTVSENVCEKIFIDFSEMYSDESDCTQDVIVSPTEYQDAPDDPVSITEMAITGNCLNIEFEAPSGCGGCSWNVKLIDTGDIAGSIPPQRTLRLSLENNEVCNLVSRREMSFDIGELQIEGINSAILHVSGREILYEY